MQCHSENLGGFTQRLVIEVDSAEVDRTYVKTYSDFAFRYHIDGIEDGKATPADIDTAFGREAIVGAVARALHTNIYPLAMDALDLVGLGTPSYQAEQLPFPGQAYCFNAQVDCSPVPTLSSYEPVHISLPELQDSDAQTEQLIARLRETEALNVLAQRVEGPLPEVLCDAEEETIIQSVYAQANQADVPFTEFLAQQGMELEEFNQDVMRRAQMSVRADLALDAWANYYHMAVSEQRLAEEFARQDLPSPALEMAEWRASGRLPQLRQAIRRRMALDDIVEHLVID